MERRSVFAHGSNNRRGVLILINEDLELEVKMILQDKQGRYICIKAEVQGRSFVFFNIYAPNKINEQCMFFK
jgi:hypothetical protein